MNEISQDMLPRHMLKGCLRYPEEDIGNPSEWARQNGFIFVDGIINSFIVDPELIESIRDNVISLFEKLPDQFRESSGRGWSSMNAAINGWEHVDVEALICMGIALGICDYNLPKQYWDVFPGGMPYIVYKDLKR